MQGLGSFSLVKKYSLAKTCSWFWIVSFAFPRLGGRLYVFLVLFLGGSLLSCSSLAGIDTGLSGDDKYAGPFPIGFSFKYYGQDYENFYVSTNGLLQFSSPTTAFENKCLPALQNTVYAFWDDLRTDVAGQPNGKIEYLTIGDAPNRKLVVQWTNQYFYSSNLPMGTFQVILHEGSGEMKLQYRYLLGGMSKGKSATIGIQGSGSHVSQLGCNQDDIVREEYSVSYVPDGSGAYYSVDSGAVYDFVDISGLSVQKPGISNRYSKSNIDWNWQKIDSINRYQIEVQLDGGEIVLSEVLGDVGVFSWSGGVSGNIYRARVRGSVNNGGTWEMWSALSDPVIMDKDYPEGSISSIMQVGGAAVELRYQVEDTLSGIDSTDLQISPNENFANISVEEGLGDGVRRVELPDGFAGQKLYARLRVVDRAGNKSLSKVYPFALIQGPSKLEITPYFSSFEASWEAAQPARFVSGYQLFVEGEQFSSVEGLQPKKMLAAHQLSTSLAGLKVAGTYHVAVVGLDASGGRDPIVASRVVELLHDTMGPDLKVLNWKTVESVSTILDGTTLTESGEFQVQGEDHSGVARIDLAIAGRTLIESGREGTLHRFAVDLTQIADGPHQLQVRLHDTLDNLSEYDIPIEVALAPPAPPTVALQGQVHRTNQPGQVLVVKGLAHSQAEISLNGTALGDLVPLDATGQAQVPLTLVEGDNLLSARLRHASRTQFSPSSTPLQVTLDTSIPDAPGNLQAVSRAQGVVQLSWAAVGNVAGYNLYAANQPFETAGDAGVTRLNSGLLTGLGHSHQTTEDGTYYYRVVAANSLGSESAPSVLRMAEADRTLPRVEAVEYESHGAVAADGRHGPGRIDVRLRMSEQLRNAPFFSLDVPQGGSIPVRLSQAANDSLDYQGSFDLSDAVPSGLLHARVSAYDPVGNEGTEIVEGKTLRVDTQGPDVQSLSLLPGHPVENLVADGQGRELHVVLRLNDEPEGMPQLTALLDEQPLGDALSLNRDAQSQPGAPVYTGRVRLPASAGAQGVQRLGFAYQARDDLGNLSERIQGRREFQVYQGDLPPLDIPQELVGRALSAGRVALAWREVDEASAYQVYRRGEAEEAFTALARVREQAFEDNLPQAGLPDGTYFYRVASVREHDGKEALSLPSEVVQVDVASKAPGAPRDLQVELTGAGISLRWLAPAEGVVAGYNLYRANVGQGQAIDVAGLTPLRKDIAERSALDSRPSESEHAYTVTALDAAGNESPPAASVYLNPALLPVSDLSIQLREGEAPQLSWEHGGSDVIGFNIYVDNAGERQKLNAELVTDKHYRDTSVVLPLVGERPYSVTAVDAQGMESVEHDIVLPALKTELRADQRFEKGVFNQIHYRVANGGGSDLQRLRLRVDVSSGGQVRQHLSGYFDVAAGAIAEVPVVVGGYPDLSASVPLSVEVLYAPLAGESVAIQRSESLAVDENTLLAQLLADEFTRGGEGNVRVRLENPSAVITELVTARGNGTQASDEMRLVLEDMDGNVLARKAVKAALGNGLVTVRDGRTVARVGALDALEAGPFGIAVPVDAPDQVRLRLEVDFLHHQTSMPGELTIGGLRSSRDLTLVDAPYRGELVSISPEQVQVGDKVTIQGRALRRTDDQPLADVELKLVLSVRGFERVMTVKTDTQGAFEYTHETVEGDSGEHLVSLVHPSIQERPQHGRFLVQGATYSPALVKAEFPRNYEQTVSIVVEAGQDTPLRNLRLEHVQPGGGGGLPKGMWVEHGAPLTLAARERGTLTLRVSGDNEAAESGLLDYRIVADGLSREIGQTRIQYRLVEARPMVKVSPTQVRTGLSRESEQVEQVTLSNSGLDVLRNVRLSLLNEQGGRAPDWVSLRTAERLGDLPAGASQLLAVAFRPGADVAERDHYFMLRLESDNHPTLDVPMSAAVTQSGKGGVIFQVEDIYTGTLDKEGQKILGLRGAKIKLQNRNVLSSEYSGATNERGQWLLEKIPAGEYSYRISAWDHEDLSGQLWIKPGVVADERVFLMNKLVNIEWSVDEMPLDDRYEINLDATFQTNLPTALVLIEPLVINLPAMRKGEVFQGELTLTNYGLIRADNVQANLPTGDARARIEYLRSVPSELESGDVVVVPYRVVALQNFDPDDVLKRGASCASSNYRGSVNYDSVCANGQVVPGRSGVAWHVSGKLSSCTGGCSSCEGGGVGIGGGGGGWGDGWGGIQKPTPLPGSKQCPPPPDCENDECGSGGNGGGL
ncbi:hypothetical protein [Pseudomonas citronellolis]|uniref:hypothetical protein n=1 Tax=Pseudomonas citronellolis TaxID=53408 RepID=UPI000AA9EA40|nr:hypothetical protein [Pseudomonas citronellolis]